MDLTYKKHTKTLTHSDFNPERYIGVDFKSYPMTEEDVSKLKNIKYIGYCGYKEDCFSGELRIEEDYQTELVIFFGWFGN